MSSAYIKAMHPKTEISPTLSSVQKILKSGWVGQMKVHGHRAQIHLSADLDQEPVVYNRQGQPHKKLLPDEMLGELRRVFHLEKGWTVIDAEWIKPLDKLYLFDVLKSNDEILRRLSYGERWKFLPRSYLSPHLQTLPFLTTVEKCMEILEGPDEDHIEGLVFKSLTSSGFEDTSIIRCRKRSSLAHVKK